MSKKEVILGFFIGLIANVIGVAITAYILGNYKGKSDSIMQVLEAANTEGFLTKVISLGALLNLIAFFYFIKKKKDYKARGVLLATVLIAVVTFIIKLT